MPQQDFNAAERQAIMRAREMYSRATPQSGEPIFHKQPPPPPPPINKPPRHNTQPPRQKPMQNSFLGMLFDGDMKLIIAMMLLLSGDGGDTLLLMALIYIML